MIGTMAILLRIVYRNSNSDPPANGLADAPQLDEVPDHLVGRTNRLAPSFFGYPKNEVTSTEKRLLASNFPSSIWRKSSYLVIGAGVNDAARDVFAAPSQVRPGSFGTGEVPTPPGEELPTNLNRQRGVSHFAAMTYGNTGWRVD
jgi:hypothetical protein